MAGIAKGDERVSTKHSEISRRTPRLTRHRHQSYSSYIHILTCCQRPDLGSSWVSVFEPTQGITGLVARVGKRSSNTRVI